MLQFLILLAAMSATPTLAQVKLPGPNSANMVVAAMKPMGRAAFRIKENGWKIPPDAGATAPGRALPQPYSAWDSTFYYGEFNDNRPFDFQLHIYSPLQLDARTAFDASAAARNAFFDASIPVERTTIAVRHGQMAADIRTRTTERGEEASLLLFARSSDGWLVKLIVYRPGSRDAVLAEAIALLDRIELPTGVKWEAPDRTPRTPCLAAESAESLAPARPTTDQDRWGETVMVQYIMHVMGGAPADRPNYCALGQTISNGLPVRMVRTSDDKDGRHSWEATIGDGGITVGLWPILLGGKPEMPHPRWAFDLRYPFGIIRLARLEGPADDADFRGLIARLDELLWNRKDPPLLEAGRPMPKR